MGATIEKNVMNFNAFLLYEAETPKTEQTSLDDEPTIKTIIERLLFSDEAGIFVTGKYKGGGGVEGSQETQNTQNTDEEEDGGDEGNGGNYFTTMQGVDTVDELRKLNNIQADADLGGAVITKIRLNNPPEPYDTSKDATRERKKKEETSAAQETGIGWARENMPELVTKIEELRRKAEEIRSSGAKGLDVAETNVRAKIEIARFLSYAREYVSEQNMRQVINNASSPVMNAIIEETKLDYMRQNMPEDYAEYQDMLGLKEECKTASVDRLADLYSQVFEIPYDRAESIIRQGKVPGATKDPIKTARASIIGKYNDIIAGKMVLVDMMMQVKGGMSQEEQDKIEKQAVAAKAEKDRLKKVTAEDMRKKYAAMNDAEIVKEIADAKNIELLDAKREYVNDTKGAVENLIKLKVDHAHFEPKKVGTVYFRARSEYTDTDVELLVPMPISGQKRKPYKKIKRHIGAEGESRTQGTYDPATGIITFTKPIVLPDNTTLGKTMEGKTRHLGYAVKTYLRVDPEDKPFIAGRTVKATSIKDLITYDPSTGVPKFVTAQVSKNDWEMLDTGAVISNAPKKRGASYYYSAQGTGTNVMTKIDVQNMLADLSDEDFAKKYAEFYDEDLDQIQALLIPTKGLNYAEQIAALKTKFEGNPEEYDKAEKRLNRDTKQERKRMTDELVNDMSGQADKIHVGLAVYDKKDKERKPADVKTPNYWIRFKVIIEQMESYKSEEREIISDKAYAESKREEKLTSDYRFIRKEIGDAAAASHQQETIEVLSDLAAEQMGMDRKQVEEELRVNREKFLDDLAWAIYDNGMTRLYADTFSTPSKPMSFEQAAEDIKRNRLEAMRRLSKKVKVEKVEAVEETPIITGYDPITKRRQISMPASMTSKKYREWINAMKEEGIGAFVTGKEIRKDYMEKNDVGGFVKTSDDVAELYAETIGVTFEKAKARLVDGTIGDEASMAKAYAKAAGVSRENADAAIKTNITHVKNTIINYNRQQMVEKIASMLDMEEMTRKRKVDYRKKYGRVSTDKEKIKETYLQFVTDEISKMSDDEAVEKYVEITGEETFDTEAMLDPDDTKSYIGREEFDKLLVKAYMEDTDIRSMTDELKINGIQVYEVPAEDMARDAAIILDMPYEDTLRSIRKNRESVIDKLEYIRKQNTDVDPNAEVKRIDIYKKYMRKTGEKEAKRSTVLDSLKDELQATPQKELLAKYAYKFVLDDEGAPEDRETLIKAILDERQKMLQLQFTRTDESENELSKMQRKDRVKQKIYKYMLTIGGLSDDMLKKVAHQELKMDDDAIQEIEGGASREEILSMLKKAYMPRAEREMPDKPEIQHLRRTGELPVPRERQKTVQPPAQQQYQQQQEETKQQEK